MLGSDNKASRRKPHSGVSRIKQSLNSRRKLTTGQMFESRGIRLVRESVGSKSPKLYRPCLKLTSIQSQVVPDKGYISQKITNRWHCRAK